MAQDNKQNQNSNQGQENQGQDPNIQSRLPETETPGPFEQVGKRGKKSAGGEKGSQGVQSGEQPIQLPKGGGAISSIGEKFQNNPFTGSGTLTVPVTISEGREDFTPQLQLSYSSGGGNGPFGTGWSMGVASITRKTDKGLPQYRDAEESDTFIMAGAEDLVPEMENDGNGNKIRKVYTSGNYSVYPYRPRIETDFSLIERWEDQNTGISHWQVVDRKNVTRVYGQSAQARVADPNDDRKVFKWLLEEKYNAKGNLIRYFFKVEDDANVDKQEDENNNKRLPLHEKNRVKYQEAFNQKYLKRVKYGNSIPYDPNDSSFDNNVDWYFELVLDYGEHHSDNPQPQPDSTWPVRKDPFSSFKAGFEVRTYRLCHRVLMFHHIDDLSTNPYLVKATEFEYEESPTMALLQKVTHRAYDDSTDETFPPLTFDYTRPQRDDQLRTLDVDDLSELPDGVDGKRYRWTDLNGEGIQGILADTPQGWYYKANRGDEEYYDPLPKANPPEPTPWFDPIQPVANKPRPTQQGGKSRQLTDLDGDGKPELVVRDTHLSGYFKTNEAGYWVSFHPFENIPRVNYDDPNLRMIDLTNNGFPDLLITENHFYRWYPANDATSFENPLKHARYHDEEEGAALVFADQTETVKLLDMSGDGLMDLVRIRNGEVSYWPNLGYGKFGRKVSMDHAPYMDRPEQFDPNRVRTADIDGTGTTDILYIRQGEAVFWENHSGNEWSAEKPIHHFPAVNDHTTVSVTDLFGNGTSSLVWSSPLPAHKGYQLRYLMLAGRDKPYMIKEMNNNMGGIQKFRYVPSTRFYLKDKYEGRDWIGRLPFPTQVLERHETYNEVTGARFVTRYAYHHGFFDTHEREFRGFGMVEQWDGERYQHFSNDTMFYLGAANESEESHVPPVHTKTWFHTGTYKDHPDLAHQYSDEYFDGDPEAEMPEDKPLPQGLSADEMREACRALKGKLLRQEVYGDDQSDVADIPYTVKVKTYRVDKKQDKAKEAQHAVFHVPELHTVTRNYERVADDPRVQHRVVMAMDAYGNVTKSGQVTYPRRGTGHDNEQKTMLITVNNKTVINETGDETASDGFYRLGVPVEQWQYQLHGVDEPSGLFTKQGLNNEFNNATLVAYENVPDNPSSSKKRIFKHNRTYYYDEQASSELPLGEVASHGLPYRQYQKVFTTGFISDVFNDGGVTRVTNTMLTDDGGYVQLDSDWWAPAERATHDNSNFYLPTGSVDPFGNSTSIQYDSYGLMPTKVTDPENNVIESDNDYRVLAPWRMTDPNDNRTEVAFDTRGMVTARAERGKSSQSLGDTLSDPTEKVSYDLFNWQDNGLPNYTHRQMREEHGSSNSRWLEQYTYTGGLGEVVMRKRKVAPGDAVERDTDGDLVYETDNQLAMEHADPRWVGTGRTVYNNKGDIVKQYEPYFSSIPDYEDEDELVAYGVTPVFHYDAPGRMIQVDHPDGTFEKVAFDAWHEKRYDPNDTVKDSQWWENRGEPKTSDPEPSDPEERAAWLAVHHYDTPQQSKLDVRGRPFMQIDDNGSQGMYETTTKLDIAGNPLEIEDAKTRITTTNHFDMRDEQARTSNIDSGLRRILLDVMGEPIYRWDDRGYTFRHSYDLLRRPLAVFVDDGSGEKKVEETVYGEEQNQAYDNNLRGEVYAVRDQSGEKVIPVYDFKGNPLEEETQFAEDYTQLLDWNSGPTLESETFTQEMSYNALNLLWQKLWDSGNKRINITYDEGGFFQSSTTMYRYQDPNNPLLADMAINSVTYNARGQRKKIQYDNGSQTVYEYDPQTFRLTRLLTTRNSGNDVLQDENYTFDAVGNIVEVVDNAQQTHYFNNSVVSPNNKYTYDPLYRLIMATGREHPGQGPHDKGDYPINDLPHPNQTDVLERYTEEYEYDEVGNILKISHSANNNNWTRDYYYASANNYLESLQSGTTQYTYDNHGNITSMPHLNNMIWDYADNLREVDLGGGGTAYYVYDNTGQRVRKVVVNNGLEKDRKYLGEYEVYREIQSGNMQKERLTLQAMDEDKLMGNMDILTYDNGSALSPPDVTERYQVGNHIDSISIELDENADLISYEEYFPFGSSSFRSGTSDAEVKLKRYRFTGKERDEETGLYEFGARYYAAWIGRFVSTDPMESQNPGKTPYHYASNNPINRVDPSGGQDDENKENQDGTGKDQENKQKKELEDYKHQNKQAQQEYEENFETLPRKEMDTDLSGKGQGENMEGPSTIEAAKISKDVYEGSNVARKGGWEKVNPNDIEGVDFKNKETGFNSALYVRKNDAEKKEYVYAFAGTTNVQDWKENIEQGLGHSEQYRTAVENAKELKQQLDGNITFVGHSLGGGLASAAAKAMGEDAITFNPAGLSGKTKDNLNLNKKADIEAYIVKGEILNQKQPFKAEGNINKIDPPEPYTTFKEYKSKFTKVGQALMGSKLYKGYQSIKLNESIKNHSMNNVIKSLKKAGY